LMLMTVPALVLGTIARMAVWVVPSLNVDVLVSETGVPALRMAVMALLDRGKELAVDASRSASAVVVLVILYASLEDGIKKTSQQIKQIVIIRRIGDRSMIRRLIFAPFLGFVTKPGPCLFAGCDVSRRTIT
jgi:hypothetical protein